MLVEMSTVTVYVVLNTSYMRFNAARRDNPPMSEYDGLFSEGLFVAGAAAALPRRQCARTTPVVVRQSAGRAYAPPADGRVATGPHRYMSQRFYSRGGGRAPAVYSDSADRYMRQAILVVRDAV